MSSTLPDSLVTFLRRLLPSIAKSLKGIPRADHAQHISTVLNTVTHTLGSGNKALAHALIEKHDACCTFVLESFHLPSTTHHQSEGDKPAAAELSVYEPKPEIDLSVRKVHVSDSVADVSASISLLVTKSRLYDVPPSLLDHIAEHDFSAPALGRLIASISPLVASNPQSPLASIEHALLAKFATMCETQASLDHLQTMIAGLPSRVLAFASVFASKYSLEPNATLMKSVRTLVYRMAVQAMEILLLKKSVSDVGHSSLDASNLVVLIAAYRHALAAKEKSTLIAVSHVLEAVELAPAVATLLGGTRFVETWQKDKVAAIVSHADSQVMQLLAEGSKARAGGDVEKDMLFVVDTEGADEEHGNERLVMDELGEGDMIGADDAIADQVGGYSEDEEDNQEDDAQEKTPQAEPASKRRRKA
jgi:hypothetical protein